MLRAEGLRQPSRSVEFYPMALAVVEAKRMELKSALARDGENGGRIESTAEEHHRFFLVVSRHCRGQLCPLAGSRWIGRMTHWAASLEPS